jgi:hypothetical protein
MADAEETINERLATLAVDLLAAVVPLPDDVTFATCVPPNHDEDDWRVGVRVRKCYSAITKWYRVDLEDLKDLVEEARRIT